MLANKDAELLHPGVAVSNVVPHAVRGRCGRQVSRRAAFRRQFDSAHQPNPVSPSERLPDFF
ncbi:MAG: hypothetical protein DME38_08630 [Verrucomicrobia bacterium]|nr:MAG: hypothetical protein DME38_08630 [Verrucomicrobiota bacterium]